MVGLRGLKPRNGKAKPPPDSNSSPARCAPHGACQQTARSVGSATPRHGIPPHEGKSHSVEVELRHFPEQPGRFRLLLRTPFAPETADLIARRPYSYATARKSPGGRVFRVSGASDSTFFRVSLGNCRHRHQIVPVIPRGRRTSRKLRLTSPSRSRLFFTA